MSLRGYPAPLTGFAVAFAATLALALLQGPKPFYYDSGNYWSLAGTFTSHGQFSLTNFASPLRGYLLPLIDHGLHELALGLSWTDSSLVKLFNSLVLSLIGAVLVPMLAETTWPKQRWGTTRRLALTALLLVFWSGYLNFPLSDLPALAMALLAIVAISRPHAARWTLLAGFATAAAIDLRPSYVTLIPIVAALAAWALFDRRADKRHLLRVALSLALGVASRSCRCRSHCRLTGISVRTASSQAPPPSSKSFNSLKDETPALRDIRWTGLHTADVLRGRNRQRAAAE